ncbi:MAG: NAD(P)/FAD-dependent oxidoreductase [Burkholderiales bacterium]|nr:NAD(P)/FAD-dependent oxidoreductase [Burkholderiales bacterium]
MTKPSAARTPSLLDCLVVGGGAAGLVAAMYLGRYRRNALVVDAGASRLAKIPRSRNVPGFPQGIAGSELHAKLKEQALQFGARLEQACVDSLQVLDGEGFEACAGERRWRARFVLLATGACDIEPELEGLASALQAGQVRYCPVCDGYETQGRRVAVLGRGEHGLREALFVAGFGNEVTWLALQSQDEVAAPHLERLRERGVRIAASVPRAVRCLPGRGVEVELRDGRVLAFDVLYPALGIIHASGLATRLGARGQEDGQLLVDAHMQTTVSGLYAAGDVAVDLNQVSVAAAHAAIAATAIHNRLP